MKRRLYPVVKHGARFALALAVLPAAIFLPAGLNGHPGDFLATFCDWFPMGLVNTVLLCLFSALLVLLVSLCEHPGRDRRLVELKPSAPLLAAGDQGDARQMAGTLAVWKRSIYQVVRYGGRLGLAGAAAFLLFAGLALRAAKYVPKRAMWLISSCLTSDPMTISLILTGLAILLIAFCLTVRLLYHLERKSQAESRDEAKAIPIR